MDLYKLYRVTMQAFAKDPPRGNAKRDSADPSATPKERKFWLTFLLVMIPITVTLGGASILYGEWFKLGRGTTSVPLYGDQVANNALVWLSAIVSAVVVCLTFSIYRQTVEAVREARNATTQMTRQADAAEKEAIPFLEIDVSNIKAEPLTFADFATTCGHPIKSCDVRVLDLPECIPKIDVLPGEVPQFRQQVSPGGESHYYLPLRLRLSIPVVNAGGGPAIDVRIQVQPVCWFYVTVYPAEEFSGANRYISGESPELVRVVTYVPSGDWYDGRIPRFKADVAAPSEFLFIQKHDTRTLCVTLESLWAPLIADVPTFERCPRSDIGWSPRGVAPREAENLGIGLHISVSYNGVHSDLLQRATQRIDRQTHASNTAKDGITAKRTPRSFMEQILLLEPDGKIRSHIAPGIRFASDLKSASLPYLGINQRSRCPQYWENKNYFTTTGIYAEEQLIASIHKSRLKQTRRQQYWHRDGSFESVKASLAHRDAGDPEAAMRDLGMTPLIAQVLANTSVANSLLRDAERIVANGKLQIDEPSAPPESATSDPSGSPQTTQDCATATTEGSAAAGSPD